MSFKVEPSALRTYASQLDEVERVAGDAQRYVSAYGDFSFHQAGIIGFAAPGGRQPQTRRRSEEEPPDTPRSWR